eukprot:2046669-Amphidinium_carterae.1
MSVAQLLALRLGNQTYEYRELSVNMVTSSVKAWAKTSRNISSGCTHAAQDAVSETNKDCMMIKGGSEDAWDRSPFVSQPKRQEEMSPRGLLNTLASWRSTLRSLRTSFMSAVWGGWGFVGWRICRTICSLQWLQPIP